MRRTLLAFLILLSAVLAACASNEPGWTYAPPTEPPPVTPAPSGASEAPPSEAPSDGGAGDDVVREVAKMTAFVNKDLSAPADVPWQLELDNQDAGVPHNIEIKGPDGAPVFKGETFNGLAVKVYDVPALAAGDYAFVCTVHPNMVGTLKVGG